MQMPCTCEQHRAGADIKIAGHQYRYEESTGAQSWPMWRWRCSCGNTGNWQYQSDSVSYHQWLRHVDRTRLDRPMRRPA